MDGTENASCDVLVGVLPLLECDLFFEEQQMTQGVLLCHKSKTEFEIELFRMDYVFQIIISSYLCSNFHFETNLTTVFTKRVKAILWEES